MPGLKRHPALQDLSRDHQRFLLEIRNIRWLITDDPRAWPIDIVVESLLDFWQTHGEMHLREEEEILLPALPIELQTLATRVLNDHAWLRDTISALPNLSTDDVKPFLDKIAQRAESHVRFEERQLFEQMQQILDVDVLTEIGEQSLVFRQQHRSPDVIGPYGGAKSDFSDIG